MGVDDYMTCPVDEDEMLLRIRALLRRAKIVSEHELKVGDTILDYDTLTVSIHGNETILPQKEFYRFISSCPTRTRSSPESSSWRISGVRNPIPHPLLSAYISDACGNGSNTVKILPYIPYGDWGIRPMC